ncbi:MAG: hypothetical protein AAGE61_19510 [Pseudomonadota bacterium]
MARILFGLTVTLTLSVTAQISSANDEFSFGSNSSELGLDLPIGQSDQMTTSGSGQKANSKSSLDTLFSSGAALGSADGSSGFDFQTGQKPDLKLCDGSDKKDGESCIQVGN